MSKGHSFLHPMGINYTWLLSHKPDTVTMWMKFYILRNIFEAMIAQW